MKIENIWKDEASTTLWTIHYVNSRGKTTKDIWVAHDFIEKRLAQLELCGLEVLKVEKKRET